MFALADYLIHIEGEPLPRDVDAQQVLAMLSPNARCRTPVTGAVYGTLLNDRAALLALGDTMHTAPYKRPPNSPVLYLKPRNTLAGHRARVEIPNDAAGVEVGASLGIVIGRTATHVGIDHAFDYVAGYTVVADISVPHASVYRPSVRFRARDKFCVIGPTVVARHYVADPDNLTITVKIAGEPTFVASTASSVRNVAQLITDVTEFMTLSAGDVLTLGVPHGSPIAQAGDEATLAIGSWAPLYVSFIGEEARDGEQP
jgi:5-oxopent-3-ene-1,2,5-tricarboxylate decarboxylase / 2-hydroxyhepta-2,4-diene-1,7-dioate isomerase